MNDNETETPAGYAHLFINDPIYDGRCAKCDCRGWGVHASKPCPVEY